MIHTGAADTTRNTNNASVIFSPFFFCRASPIFTMSAAAQSPLKDSIKIVLFPVSGPSVHHSVFTGAAAFLCENIVVKKRHHKNKCRDKHP